jgi:Kdo2-lipid IVA lauroyltransferase/acyltransferase
MKKNKKSKYIRNKILILIYRFFGNISFKTNQNIGIFLGIMLYLIPNRQKKIAKINIKLCYPNLSCKEQKRFLKSNLKALGMSVFETAYLWHAPTEDVKRLIKEPINQQIFKNALKNKEKIILGISHFGNWEVAILDFNKNSSVCSLYAKAKHQDLEEYFYKRRIRLGWDPADGSGSGIKKLLVSLKKSKPICIACDQVPGPGSGIFTLFFNNIAYTMTLLVQLAQKTNATIIFVAMERLDSHQGFRMHYIKPVKQIYDSDLKIAIAGMNKTLEKCISVAPTQYMWSYKRFKVQPKKNKNPYR